MNEELSKLLKFNEGGLIPAIAQQQGTGEILMMAWMNADAIEETLATRQVCYWSRSRQSLWRKGESSGHVQTLVDFRLDCDGDTILLVVDQKGVACHTGRHNCFFYSASDTSVDIISEVEISPEEMYGDK